MRKDGRLFSQKQKYTQQVSQLNYDLITLTFDLSLNSCSVPTAEWGEELLWDLVLPLVNHHTTHSPLLSAQTLNSKISTNSHEWQTARETDAQVCDSHCLQTVRAAQEAWIGSKNLFSKSSRCCGQIRITMTIVSWVTEQRWEKWTCTRSALMQGEFSQTWSQLVRPCKPTRWHTSSKHFITVSRFYTIGTIYVSFYS